MYSNSNSIPNNGKIGPPPSMGGYQNRTNKNSEGVVEHSNYPAPTSVMPATYAPPSYAPPLDSSSNQNNLNQIYNPPSQHGNYPAPESQTVFANRALPPPPPSNQQAPTLQVNNPTGFPTTYRTNAPPPIAINTSVSSDSNRSSGNFSITNSNRNSGSYPPQQQGYYTGAPPPTNQMRLFNNLTPTLSSNNLHSLMNTQQQQPHTQQQQHSPASPKQSQPPGSNHRIDPSQMPRPDKPLQDVTFHTKSGSGRRNPPSCNSLYTAVDTGNCIPRHMRTTLVSYSVHMCVYMCSI